MEVNEFVDTLRKFYNSNHDKDYIVDLVERELDCYELIKKRVAMEKAIKDYLKVKHRTNEIPDGLIGLMVDRIDKPVTYRSTINGQMEFYDE